MTEVPFADPDLDEIPAFLRAAPPAPAPAREGPVTLPPSGSGERARRRRQRRRLTWRRRSLLVVIAVMVIAAVGRGLALGGAPLFQVTLENLVGVPLPGITIVKDAQLTSFVQAAGPLAVEVPDRVEQTDGRGNVNILWEQGPATVAPADVP